MNPLYKASELLLKDGKREEAFRVFQRALIDRCDETVKVFTASEWQIVKDFLYCVDYDPRLLFDFHYLNTFEKYEGDFYKYRLEGAHDSNLWANGVRSESFFLTHCLSETENDDSIVISLNYGRIKIQNNHFNTRHDNSFVVTKLCDGSEHELIASFIKEPNDIFKKSKHNE